MILTQNPKTGYWDKFADGPRLMTHSPEKCADHYCAIHNHPSDHPLKDAPLNWRTDRNILERICSHGVGHPDRDSANHLASIGHSEENIHGCCGCCNGLRFDNDSPLGENGQIEPDFPAGGIA